MNFFFGRDPSVVEKVFFFDLDDLDLFAFEFFIKIGPPGEDGRVFELQFLVAVAVDRVLEVLDLVFKVVVVSLHLVELGS